MALGQVHRSMSLMVQDQHSQQLFFMVWFRANVTFIHLADTFFQSDLEIFLNL